MKRILITGARGFVGHHTIQYFLALGYEIVATTTRGDHLNQGIRWIQCNLLDSGNARRLVEEARPTHLLHLAWYTEHGRFWDGLPNLQWLRASLEIVEAFAAAGGSRAVIASSCAEYDWLAPSPCREFETPLRPQTLYGACKKSVADVTNHLASLVPFSLAWFRLFHLHGPGETTARFVPSLIRSLLRGQPALMTHGQQVRDLLHVSEVGSAIAALTDSDIRGPVNIGSGEPVRLLDVATYIADALDCQALLRVGNLPPRPGEPADLYPDVSRLRREVGWSPRLSFAEGLDDSIAWWADSGDRDPAQ